ncbi:MAG TPA: GntR family transcriptional regulator [Solirubrobacteraceae bacterium]|jgi:DNA-binding GntR family transcriptional regulator|nr:GntR family transcriptional regulator [Solirubrobacteraceae bacterium]
MSARPGSERTRSTDAYRELRRRLLLGEYPSAARLAEIPIAAQLGVSRTPVREALWRLEAEALVERRPDGGFFPRIPDLAAIRDLYEVRRALELEVIERPARHGTKHDAVRLSAVHQHWTEIAADPPDPDPGFIILDEHFHVGIAEACGNNALVEHLALVNARIRVVRMQNFVHTHRIVETAAQHLAIIDTLQSGDTTRARQLMEAHLDEATRQSAERAARAVERMLTPDGGKADDPLTARR